MNDLKIDFSIYQNEIAIGFYGNTKVRLKVDSILYDYDFLNKLKETSKESYNNYFENIKKIDEEMEQENKEIAEMFKSILFAQVLKYKNNIEKLKESYDR